MNKTVKRNKRFDPTQTTVLRRKFMAEATRRFKKIRTSIYESIVDLDVFGLQNTVISVFQKRLLKKAFQFMTSPEKYTAFMEWLREMEDEELLTVLKGEGWTSPYVASAYRKGKTQAYIEMKKLDGFKGTSIAGMSHEEFLKSAFMSLTSINKLEILYQRTYTNLKNITTAMDTKISSILAQGIADGKHPIQMAREMTKTVDNIGIVRARTLARTEVIHAHAEGALDMYEEAGLEEVTVEAEWSTAGDDMVCDLCAPLEGVIMSISEARGLIPRHPNCRCTWIPSVKKEKGQKRGEKKEKAIDKSLKNELPQKTKSGQEIPQTVEEAVSRTSWMGKGLK